MGLGSNRGDSKTILAEAIKRFTLFLSEIRTSSVYIPKPQDYLEIKLLRLTSLRSSSRTLRYTGEHSLSSPCWNCILTTVIPLRNSRSPLHSLPYPIKACEKVSDVVDAPYIFKSSILRYNKSHYIQSYTVCVSMNECTLLYFKE